MTPHGRFIDDNDNVKVCKSKALESNDLSRARHLIFLPFLQYKNAEARVFCSHQQTILIVCAIFKH